MLRGMTHNLEIQQSTERLTALEPQLSAWRRHLHQHPEVSFQEHQTAAYIAAELRGMGGLEVSQQIGRAHV